MAQIRVKSFVLAFVSVLSILVYAQTPKPSFILSAPDTLGQRTYVARNYILLKPGYQFSPKSSGDVLIAKINTALTFNITTIPNPVPGDISSASSDLPYTPGNSFTADVSNGIVGVVPSMISTFLGTSIMSDEYHVFPIAWFKTVPKTNNLNGLYYLKDITSNGAELQKAISSNTWVEFTTTRDKMRTYNFNPAVDFTNDNTLKRIKITTTNLAQATILGVWGAKGDFNKDKFLFTLQGRANDWALFSKKAIKHSNAEYTDLDFGNSLRKNFLFSVGNPSEDSILFHEKALRLGDFYKTNFPDKTVWGESHESYLAIGRKSDSIPSWVGIDGFNGYVPEILIFNKQLSKREVQIYNSYLAIKYGVTMDTSYLSGNGEVIWDYALNQTFKNRITGYGREDALGLMQKIATTSYEERPYFSDINQYDSYDLNSSFNAASRYRLLVMGCQPANPIQNSRYVIFGDDNGSLNLTVNQNAEYTKVIPRKWRLYTNTWRDAIPGKVLHWTVSGQNLLVTKRYYNQYRYDLTKTASNDSSSWVTEECLKQKDGYFAWTVDLEYGPVMAKFGTNQPRLVPNSHDYGYRIDTDGQVYRIIKGRIDGLSLFTVEKGQRVEIEKNDKILCLKVNGTRYKNTEFEIASSDTSNVYYGAILMGKNTYDFKLIDFRHGGFVNTGHKVELSYDSLRASGFSNPVLGKIYLLIDPTGQGDFSTNVLSYPCDEIDITRSKIIFNNVFWDANSTGKYAFTFAYKDVATLRSLKDKSDSTREDIYVANKLKDDIQIYRKGGSSNVITVRSQTSKMIPVQINVYDLMGRLVEHRELAPSKEFVYSYFKLPTSGIYIIKILTKTKIYTHEVLSK